MTQPMDPNLTEPGNSEYSWGPGTFPPGIANNEGQLHYQDDFGGVTGVPACDGQTLDDNYARAVADRRTDAVDPSSTRDFTTTGNMDRYGKNPPLVRAEPEPNSSPYSEFNLPETPRGW